MKLKRIIAGLSAAALASTCFAFAASAATKLSDLVYPSETDDAMNDAYYGICAIGFFMNNGWTGWNQQDSSDVATIDENGILDATFDITEGWTFGGTGEDGVNHDNTLGMMGFMICNLPNDGYPYEVEILEAEFTPKEGSTIELDSIKSITELDVFPEKKDSDVKDARVVVRATPDDTNDIAATPEVEGMDQEGNFKGGTLHIKFDFGAPPAPAEDSSSEAADSAADGNSSSNDSGSSGGSSGGSSTSSSSSATDSSSAAADSSSAADTTSSTAATADAEPTVDNSSKSEDVKSASSTADSSSSSSAAASSSSSKAATTSTASTTTTTTGGSTTTTTTSSSAAAAASEAPAGGGSDNTESSGTGVAEGITLGLLAAAALGVAVSKKRS